MNLKEIEERIAQIGIDVDKEGADINKLSIELNELTEERKKLLENVEIRNRIKRSISNDGGTPFEKYPEIEHTEKRTFGIDTKEYRTAFLKKMQGKELEKEEREAVTGKATIPTILVDEIEGKMELSPIYNAVEVTNIKGNVTFPVESSAADASWLPMSANSTDSADGIEQITLSSHKLIKTISISADVQAMSISAFGNWMTSRLANKMMKAASNSILSGTGTNQPTGILKSEKVTQKGTFTKAGMTFKDLCKTISSVGTEYLQGAKFVMPRKLFYGDILGMEDTNKNRVVVVDPQSPARFNILGYPVIVDDGVTEDTLIFGDLSVYKFNWAQEIELKRDESAEFKAGNTCFRALALADGKVTDGKGLCIFTRSAT